jgi:hypothetical protein
MTTLLRQFSFILFTGFCDQVVHTCKHWYVRISEQLVYTVIEFVKKKHSYMPVNLNVVL